MQAVNRHVAVYGKAYRVGEKMIRHANTRRNNQQHADCQHDIYFRDKDFLRRNVSEQIHDAATIYKDVDDYRRRHYHAQNLMKDFWQIIKAQLRDEQHE